MKNTYIFNVISIKRIIASGLAVKAENESQARAVIYSWLLDHNLINNNLFYKLELVETKKELPAIVIN